MSESKGNWIPGIGLFSVLLLAIYGLIRIFYWTQAFPGHNEAYYWLWGKRLELSYYDHPPLFSWLQGLFDSMLPKSPFSLRLTNLFTNSVILLIFYRWLKALMGRQNVMGVFIWVLLCLLASPLFFNFFAFAYHDHLMMMFVVLSLHFFLKFTTDFVTDRNFSRNRDIYLSALFLGLGGLTKYNSVFVAFAYLTMIVWSRDLRPLLKDRRFYIAILISGAAVAPMLIWNMINGFPSFKYHLVNRNFSSGVQLRPKYFFAFLATGLITLSPFTAILFTRGWRAFTPQTTFQALYKKLALLTFLCTTVPFLFLSFFSTVLYYWNIIGYLLLFPMIPWAAVGRNAKSLRLFSFGQHFYGLFFAVGFVFHMTQFPLSALINEGVDRDSRMVYGWNEVEKAVRSFQQTSADQNTFLLATDYRIGSALSYQLDERNIVVISRRRSQFDFWYPGEPLNGRDAIIVADDWHPLTADLRRLFSSVSEPQVIDVYRHGIKIKQYFVFKGINFQNDNSVK